MPDFDTCCGFGGEFFIKNNTVSRAISKVKAENILRTGADIVLTTCQGCILGVKQGIKFSGGKTKVKSLTEFLASAREIIYSK